MQNKSVGNQLAFLYSIFHIKLNRKSSRISNIKRLCLEICIIAKLNYILKELFLVIGNGKITKNIILPNMIERADYEIIND